MKPRDIVCSACGATNGARCTRPINGPYANAREELPYHHAERMDAAFEQLEKLTRAALDSITALFRDKLNQLQEEPEPIYRERCTNRECGWEGRRVMGQSACPLCGKLLETTP